MAGSTPGLNPFTIPSGTLVRFLLLVAAASTAVLGSLYQDAAVLLGVRGADVIAYQVCVQQKLGTAVAQPNSLTREAIRGCHDPRTDVGIWPNVLALMFFWLLVLALYWMLPWWRIRRRRLLRLDPAQFPELAAYLGSLQREAGLHEPVSFLLAPLNPKVAGLAFGRIRQRHVMLSGGLVALFTRDRTAFRTVVLHELAHIRNRDLDISFITILVWRVVAVLLVRELLGATLSVASGLFPGYGIASTVASTVQIILLAVVVPLARNAVLRSRELYADARTAQWDSSPQSLQYLFDVYSRVTRPSGGALRVHPPLIERRAALDNAQEFFTVGFWEMVGVGLMVTLTTSLISEFISHPDFTTGPGQAIEFILPALIAAPLLATGVGLSIWRDVIRASVTGTATALNRPGFGLAIGLALGALITPTDVFNFYGTHISPLGIMIPWVVFMLLSGLAIVHWITLIARCWLPAAASRDHPVRTIMVTLATISVPLSVWLGIAVLVPTATLTMRIINPGIPEVVLLPLVAVGMSFFPLSAPVLIPLLVFVAVLPLAGITWSQRSSTRSPPANWISLDPLLSNWYPTTARSATRIALQCSAIAIAVGVAIVLITEIIGSNNPEVPIDFAAVLAQLTAAVLASARIRYLRTMHGIAAAFLAGTVVLLFSVLAGTLLSGEIPLTGKHALLIPAAGLLASACAALATAGPARAIGGSQSSVVRGTRSQRA